MKRILGILAAGLVVLALQGALATFLPPALCPDLGLLYTRDLGIHGERSTPLAVRERLVAGSFLQGGSLR